MSSWDYRIIIYKLLIMCGIWDRGSQAMELQKEVEPGNH